MSQKVASNLDCYNFEIHRPIVIFFGRHVLIHILTAHTILAN